MCRNNFTLALFKSVTGFREDENQQIRFQLPKTGLQKSVPTPCWVPVTVSGIVLHPGKTGCSFFRDSAKAERIPKLEFETTPAACDASVGSGEIQCLRKDTDGKRAWHGAAYTSGRESGEKHNPIAGQSLRWPQLESLLKNLAGRDKSVRSTGSTVVTVKRGQTPAGEVGRDGLTRKSPQVSLLNLCRSGMRSQATLNAKRGGSELALTRRIPAIKNWNFFPSGRAVDAKGYRPIAARLLLLATAAG